ncbi:MAG: flagellar basal body-associated FliL family protein [Deltaproteobacteria bacterium]|nr:flagellar basal body-associated FliL family protein [Deltaproteobacteria bacterium]
MAEGQKDSEGKKSSGLIKYLLFGSIGLVLLVGVGAAGFFLSSSNIFGKKDEPQAAAPGQGEQGGQESAVAGLQIGPMLDIDSFIVNILDEEGTHYLKAAVTLEVDTPFTLDEINKRMPQIRDAILLQVGNKTFRELADLEGKLQLRAELISRLNEILETGEIKKIYFTDFVVQ